jgi:choline dehydrogenase-like flavoprotein
MDSPRKPGLGTEQKVFDPRDPSTGSGGAELLDPSVVQRGEQWWMYLAGQAGGYGATDIYSASLPSGAPLSAAGWNLTRGPAGELVPVAGRRFSRAWDGNGGRHCPSYVKGWDPRRGEWVERIYYAGGAENLWGPYTIGFLQWDGEHWIDQPQPAFNANEDWEHGSVYEPNLICHDGKWKMWYVAGSNQEDYLVQGYAESEDGSTGWSRHAVFAPPEMRMFDFCVRQRGRSFDAIFARVGVRQGTPLPETGLWWCTADRPSSALSRWSKPIQIMRAEDRGWHSGPWKPSFQFPEQMGERALVFFDGAYRTSDPGPFPFAFTLGCFEIDLPPACDDAMVLSR